MTINERYSSTLALNTFCLSRSYFVISTQVKNSFDYYLLMSYIRSRAKNWKRRSTKPLHASDLWGHQDSEPQSCSMDVHRHISLSRPGAVMTDTVEIHRWHFNLIMISSYPSSIFLFSNPWSRTQVNMLFMSEMFLQLV